MERYYQDYDSFRGRLYYRATLGALTLSLVSCSSYAEVGSTAQEEYCGSEELVSYDPEDARICAVDDVDGFVEVANRRREAEGGTLVLTNDALVDEVIRNNDGYWDYAASSRLVEEVTRAKQRTGMTSRIAPLKGDTYIDDEPVIIVSLER